MSDPNAFVVVGHALVAIPGRTTKARIELLCRECGGKFSIALQETLDHSWSSDCEACFSLARAMKLSPVRGRGGR